MDAKVCLVVIFNHQYNRNLPALRALYNGRFSHIRFLVPFYRGTDTDVIPVFASSSTFQGYVAQGQRFFAADEFSHYVCVADDMLLNPRLDETNILAALKLGKEDAYIQELRPLTDVTFRWPFLHMTLKACRFNNFVNALPELPSRQEAFERLAAHGTAVTTFGWKNLRLGHGGPLWKARSFLVNALFLYGSKGVRKVVYPLAMSYADFFVVPAVALPEFSHFCGVFAAMGIFVECALPTALALAARSIRKERDIELRGIEMFDPDALAAFEQRYRNDFRSLLADFPADALYIHPIKLSRWQGA